MPCRIQNGTEFAQKGGVVFQERISSMHLFRKAVKTIQHLVAPCRPRRHVHKPCYRSHVRRQQVGFVRKMVLQPFCSKERCRAKKVRVFAIYLLQHDSHRMTDVCMACKAGVFYASDKVVPIVVYDKSPSLIRKSRKNGAIFFCYRIFCVSCQ